MMAYSPFHILFVFLILYLPGATANQAYPVITYTCDKSADVLKIKNEVKWGDEGKNFKFSDAAGLYSPWDWVEMEDKGKRRLVRQKKSVELICELSQFTYKVVLKPKLFNPNYFGQCGKRISVKVSIYAGEKVLLRNQALESFCHGNAKVIKGIKVFGDNGRLKLYKIAKHKFH